MTTIAELKEHLKGYADDISCAYALWLPEDVQWIAEDNNISLSPEQIDSVLYTVHKRHDANYGISWENLHQAVLEEIESEKKE